ncbi:RNA-directed DNA polymerase [Prosthecobacter dejongeii]|uniref:Reverse transcriptase domain-containing protein n=1 Tax=Prosthecobacter dejongeii TaxID=48465 RepID=A0A7W7YHC1_9BACT|nr:RNA-directed DNA polymerase [Prosthecobacter dejongeii]MBB5036144.1 hypothetical protein [Prosthecobacter dejongeii]
MSLIVTPRLALRALNDSRKSDPLSYLSLRYTLTSVISLKDVWAQNMAPEIVRRRGGPGFLESKLFKQLDGEGVPEFRDIVRAGGPEALAEVALLDACSKAGKAFQPADEVYSYHFAKRSSVDGAFIPYFELFSARQTKIGEICKKRPGDWVLYADIKQFYPSITPTRAFRAWERACEDSTLSSDWKEFGRLLLNRQFSLKKGLLVGSSFSHLVANLVLRDLDKEMSKKFPGRYFRYVDDFAFIVPPEKKRETITFLRAHIKPLGLRLHPKKIHWIGATKWRENAPYQQDDYDEEPTGDEDWMRFIDNLKCYLMERPQYRGRVKKVFQDAGLRVPLPRYTTQTMAKSYGDRFKVRMESKDFAKRLAKLSPKKLTTIGLRLRKTYFDQFMSAWQNYISSTGAIRKWKLSKVRFILSRIMLLGSLAQVQEIHEIIENEVEVAEYTAMLAALLTGEVDELLRFGWKTAASAGQALAVGSISTSCRSIGWKDEQVEAYTALLLAGVTVNVKLPKRLKINLRIQTVKGGNPPSAWSRISHPFYREISALIGSKTLENHRVLLQTPADPDERWEPFADELLGFDPT